MSNSQFETIVTKVWKMTLNIKGSKVSCIWSITMSPTSHWLRSTTPVILSCRTSAPNDHKMTFNTYRSKVPHIDPTIIPNFTLFHSTASRYTPYLHKFTK